MKSHLHIPGKTTLLCAVALTAALPTASAQCCGRTSPNQPRIVGGVATAAGAYPWMTALVERGQTPSNGQFCGGALIAPQWVLTAGHCVVGTTAARLDVIIGAYDLRLTNGGGQRVQVTQIISHPSYGETGGTLTGDVALLKLATPVTNVSFIPLVDSAAVTSAGMPCKGMGFGLTNEGGSSSPALLQVDMSFISLTTANAVYDGLTSAHLAAGLTAGGRDTCQGDSGGPLVVPTGTGGWMHAGVVSFGDGCARPGVPGIYANTFAYSSWIRQQTGAVTPPPVDDFGNTIAAAATVASGAPVSGSLESAGDVDMFKITVGSAGTLTAGSSGTTALGGQILNASGIVILQQTGAPAFNLSAPVAGASTYYLSVRGATSSTTGAYRAVFTFTPAPVTGAPEMDLLGKNTGGVADGAAVADDAAGTAFGPVTVGQPASNSFTIRNSGSAALTLGSAVISGTGAAHFRVSVQPVTTVAAGRTAAFTVVYAPTTAGTHVADISIANNDANENPYNVRLAGTAIAVSGDDHGNTIAASTSVAIPVTRAAKIEKSGDVDVFKFTVTASTTLTLKTTGSTDTYGTLYNSSGSILAEADDYADLNFRIRRTFSPGTYYLAVDGYDASVTGSYTVSIAP